MDSPVVVDTNVLVVANNRVSPHATPECVRASADFLRGVTSDGHLVIDDGFEIIREYMNKVDSTGQPGVGDAFLKWLLSNRTNHERCTCVPITPDSTRSYHEFPIDLALSGFDPSDRKFVAVALVHPDRPEIANAVDRDWEEFRTELGRHGVRVRQLCHLSLRVPKPGGVKKSRRRS